MTRQDGAARHRAELFFQLPPDAARAIHGALSPETKAEVPKTESRVALEPGGVRVHLLADDLSSLRAGVNSWLRWVDAAEKSARLGLATPGRQDADGRHPPPKNAKTQRREDADDGA